MSRFEMLRRQNGGALWNDLEAAGQPANIEQFVVVGREPPPECGAPGPRRAARINLPVGLKHAGAANREA
jgi:hypothetical protein